MQCCPQNLWETYALNRFTMESKRYTLEGGK